MWLTADWHNGNDGSKYRVVCGGGLQHRCWSAASLTCWGSWALWLAVVVVYMDDVIVPSLDFEEGLVKLNDVLQVALRNGFHINWSKCQDLHSKEKFLRFKVKESHQVLKKCKHWTSFPYHLTKKALRDFWTWLPTSESLFTGAHSLLCPRRIYSEAIQSMNSKKKNVYL